MPDTAGPIEDATIADILDISNSPIGSTITERERTDPEDGSRENMVIDQEL